MENQSAKFDWIGWLATVPGIPAGWGEAPADPAPVPVVSTQAATCASTAARVADDIPERKAA